MKPEGDLAEKRKERLEKIKPYDGQILSAKEIKSI